MTRLAKLDWKLKGWGVIRMNDEDYADEYGENILYRCGILQGRVDEPFGRDKILCPDRPKWFREVDKAVNRLPFAQRQAIFGFYCVPIKEDGHPLSEREVADLLGISVKKFYKDLRDAKRKLLDILTV